ncbi:hypothetical protein H8E88_27465 [candidate division KSB1 bacterium]|nr:hypothetical protein [candidate division KSB1 bacterium]
MIEFPRDFKEFLQLLNSKKIDYLVIGGYAVGYHGYPRATGDMDIWIAINEQNAIKMVEALKEFGFDLPELQKELFLIEQKVIRMGVPPMRLEILTSIDGVNFKTCFNNRIIADFGDFKVNFISKDDLLINKRASGRLQDLVDFEKLQIE